MTAKVTFNGKFFGVRPTGVHRVAEELIAACDRHAKELSGGNIRLRLAARHDVEIPSYRHIQIVRESASVRWMHRIAWEQLYLPFLCRGEIAVNLCNIGPLPPSRSITMIHDAQVYSTPASYSLPFRLWYRFIIPLLGRRHKLILTVSEHSKREIVRYGIAKPEKIVVVHNGCDHVLRLEPDTTILTRLGLKPGNYAIALSNTQKHKNIALLLESFHAPALAEHQLVLFGGATKADFEHLGHKVPPNVVFAGRISDEELAGLVSQGGALAFPSLTEGFGLPPLEAMMLGCPVLAAPCGALPEVCGDAALYAAPDNAQEWVCAIKLVLNDTSIRDDLIVKGRLQAARFTWRRAAQEVMDAVDLVSQAREKPSLTAAKPLLRTFDKG